jgi:C4-dicarboxylate-specific signal transduction histidine kinase
MYQKVHRDMRTEMIGGLSAALAHELIQPLGAILSNAEFAHELLRGQNPDLAEIGAAIDDIILDNSRAVNLVQSVKAVFQRSLVEKRSLDIKEVLFDVNRITAPDAAKRGIAMRVDVPAMLPAVTGNKTQLTQALMNLVLNAFDAMSENNGFARELVIRASQRELDQVCVTVCDSGSGIEPEAYPRLFDPFSLLNPWEGYGPRHSSFRSSKSPRAAASKSKPRSWNDDGNQFAG